MNFELKSLKMNLGICAVMQYTCCLKQFRHTHSDYTCSYVCHFKQHFLKLHSVVYVVYLLVNLGLCINQSLIMCYNSMLFHAKNLKKQFYSCVTP